ncbi:DUF973 family protein [Acidianus sulfidivorans JP7]|uniref:DUF973 domain-containing protein n=1 Tax=Acidianus sulfidivorans JP7 TaxID=619593 RepID=A0A2U9IJR5_9CREN|nr:DUF973 family protein [Acidianus sulfidivorans]AWR96196.1 DUF973 family protein [Acidianus sulfidivorans JP7]
MSIPSNNEILLGLNDLKKGLYYYIIYTILFIIELVALISLLFILAKSVTAALDIIIGFVIVALILLVFVIISVIKLRSGFSKIKTYIPDTGIGYTGSLLLLIGVILSIIIVLPFSIIGGVILTIGEILVGIGFYELGKYYNNSSVKNGGIIMIIPLPFFWLIGTIMVYSGLKSIITKVQEGMPSTPTNISNVQKQIVQVGVGSIDNSGYAYLTLYSQVNANIISALLEGTNIPAISTEPMILVPGNNNLKIYFGQQNFTQDMYGVRITVNIAGSYQEVLASLVTRKS